MLSTETQTKPQKSVELQGMKKALQTALYPVKLNCYDGQPSLKSEQWIWIIAASVLHTIITQVICSDFLELMKKGLKLLKRSTKTNSTEKKFDYYQAFHHHHPSYGQVPPNNVCVMSMRVPAPSVAAV